MGNGRAGVRVRISAAPEEGRHFREDDTVDEVRDHGGTHCLADILVSFGRPAESADALVSDGTPQQLGDLLVRWHEEGVTGFRPRPVRLPRDLSPIVDEPVPELRRRGVLRRQYATSTLRGHLGLPRPADRYAA